MKILIAEDDPLTREGIDAILTQEGFQTILASNGKEALALWKQNNINLLCLDVMMPELDGFEVCRRIRKENEHIPVIFLSAKSEEIDVVVGLELGADDFVRKPFGKHELLARIRSVLRRTANRTPDEESSSFTIRDLLQIFPNELRAIRLSDQSEITLTPREISILTLLYDHSDEAISRNVILDQCWGTNYFPESRSLDQYIAQLRKKIEQDPSSPKIVETARGVGYRIRSS